MSPFDEFDRVLSQFDHLEERQFLNNIQEFGAEYPEVVIKTFSVLLKNQTLNLQLKFLILKACTELRYPGLIPTLQEVLRYEDREQIITEAVHALAAIGTLSAYKIIVGFIKTKNDIEYKKKIEHCLKTILIRNQLVYHFDIFYCNKGEKGEGSNIKKSSEFLIKHLPEENVKDLLPAVNSRFYKIKLETLRILKNRPQSIYYSTIYYLFKENALTADEELFLAMSEVLINCASLSSARKKIFQKLKIHLTQFKGDRQHVFGIVLLKLNPRDTIPYIIEIYTELNIDRKLLLFEYFTASDYHFYKNFLRNLLSQEDNQIILAKIIEILINARDFKYLFNNIDKERGGRKHELLHLILGHAPVEIDKYLKKYITPSQENQILLTLLTYLLKHCADKCFELISRLFFSGVSLEIKIHILQNLDKFSPHHQILFVGSILNDLQVVRDLKNEFLVSLSDVINEKIFNAEMKEKILNQVLVLMEEASLEEIASFIDFFHKYEVCNKRDGKLIIDEFRLIRETIAKAGFESIVVRNINALIEKIAEKVKLKQIPK